MMKERNAARGIAWAVFAVLVVCSLWACRDNDFYNQTTAPTSLAEGRKTGTLVNLDNRRLATLMAFDKNLLLVDVRREEELSGEYPMLEGALHLQDSLLFENPDTLPHNKTIVLMCRTGHRSAAVAKMLTEHGYTIYNLENGLRGYYHPEKKDGSSSTPASLTKKEWENEKGC
ncbi:MAG: rhodanese-like domain-containing protein [Saprospiraceae bacterium]|nr:MAG: rhodanese-like domain-containing protein [Saprospiraceae bacterium]